MKNCKRCGKPHGAGEACILNIFGSWNLDMANHGALLPPPAIDLSKPGDYGCDPLGDGTFRMVPSGDIVDAAERARRLGGR